MPKLYSKIINFPLALGRTSDYVPSDNIRMDKSSKTMVYYNYYRATQENESLKHSSSSLDTKNRYLTARVKTLEAEKGVLERKLIVVGKDPQAAREDVSLLK